MPKDESRTVLVRYKQMYWGELIEDSYYTKIDSHHTKLDIEMALYEDPHVCDVQIIELNYDCEGEDEM